MSLTPAATQFLRNISYSSGCTKNTCPRQFQMDKLGPRGGESTVTFAFGHAVGAGIQTLLCGFPVEKAIWNAFLAWDVDLLSEEEKSKKSFDHAVYAIQKFVPYAASILEEWEVVYYNGRPAVELSFKLLLPNGYVYRAHIDIVLKNRTSGKLLVVELKTTSFTNIHPATYGNSAQALSYSVVLDRIAALAEGENSYEVLYIPYKTKEQEFEPMPFAKSILDKARWIKTILLDCEEIERYIQEDFFPQRGQNCVQFFRPCRYYEMCGMSDQYLFASDSEIEGRLEKEDAQEYTFTFTLQEIIDQQLSTANS
jgi:hypothetical protein